MHAHTDIPTTKSARTLLRRVSADPCLTTRDPVCNRRVEMTPPWPGCRQDADALEGLQARIAPDVPNCDAGQESTANIIVLRPDNAHLHDVGARRDIPYIQRSRIAQAMAGERMPPATQRVTAGVRSRAPPEAGCAAGNARSPAWWSRWC